MAPTAFLGLSHLGVISSIGWASLGEPVTAVDVDPSPVARLQAGELPVLEPSLEELFAATRGRMTFGTDPSLIRDASLVVVARDVPTDAGNASDLAAVNDLLEKANKPPVINRTVINKTTEMLAQENRAWGVTFMGLGAAFFAVGAFRYKAGRS